MVSRLLNDICCLLLSSTRREIVSHLYLYKVDPLVEEEPGTGQVCVILSNADTQRTGRPSSFGETLPKGIDCPLWSSGLLDRKEREGEVDL